MHPSWWAARAKVGEPGLPTARAADLVRRFAAPWARLMHRPTLSGVENLPASGAYMLVANHSGAPARHCASRARLRRGEPPARDRVAGPVLRPRAQPLARDRRGVRPGLRAVRRRRRGGGARRARDPALRRQILASLGFLVRSQMGPVNDYLARDPAAARGAMRQSATAAEARIDYAQHAGAALLRASELVF